MHAHRPFSLIILLVLVASLAAPRVLLASSLGEPCCTITAVAANGMVTARETKTGRVFTFQVTNQAVIAGLYVGQPVWADFGTKKVALTETSDPCCSITSAVAYKPVNGLRQPDAAEACCSITAVHPNGLVSARDNKTERVFQFQVADQTALHGLRVGQPVWADFAARAVALAAGAEVCCGMTGPVAAGPVEGLRQPDRADVCCSVVANPALTGEVGRLVVAFPAGADASTTRIAVFNDAGTQRLREARGSLALDLLPGTYRVIISGKPVTGVKVQAGHDTRVRVGMIRFTAAANTHIVLLDVNDKRFAEHRGSYVVGLPVGAVHLRINGVARAVTVQDNKITEY